MTETILKEITQKTNKEQVKNLVECYMKCILDEENENGEKIMDENRFAQVLMDCNKETIVTYILLGMEQLKKTQGKQLKIMRKKGLI